MPSASFDIVMFDATSIRPLGPGDAPVVAALHAASWHRAYRGILRDSFLDVGLLANREAHWSAMLGDPSKGHGWLLSAVPRSGGDADPEPAGFVFLDAATDPTWGTLVDNLHVLPTHQGRGYGRLLLRQVGAWCARHAPSAGVYLWVFKENVPARGFYCRVGGVEVEQAIRLASDGQNLPEYRVSWASPAALLDGTQPTL